MEASPIRCLVSAGPTREYFDPVRFLSNPSSGRMGFAIAEAARARGWEVVLVSGPAALPDPAGVRVVRVETGEEMHAALLESFAECDVLFMTAAVMDTRPRHCSPHKVKKDQLPGVIEMVPATDILADLGRRKAGQTLVGFAAETENLEANARAKLERKNLDLIAANVVGVPGSGFVAETNRIVLLSRDGGREVLGPASKHEIADLLITRVAPLAERAREGRERP
ncbi:MAG: phosphopantothenoylcysteine decarboxylase [Opitutales bacterium]|nr:phosphopantothenoylcysteine decarboxylase [Opitutales bacterium]